MKKTTTMLTDEQHRWITARAKERGCTVAQILRDLVWEAVDSDKRTRKSEPGIYGFADLEAVGPSVAPSDVETPTLSAEVRQMFEAVQAKRKEAREKSAP